MSSFLNAGIPANELRLIRVEAVKPVPTDRRVRSSIEMSGITARWL